MTERTKRRQMIDSRSSSSPVIDVITNTTTITNSAATIIDYLDASGRASFRMSDQDLGKVSVRDLNWSLRKHPKEVVHQVKDRRRLLKNRGYAQSTRVKVTELSEDLELQKQQLTDDIRNFKRANNMLEEQLRNLGAKRKRLHDAVKKKKSAGNGAK